MEGTLAIRRTLILGIGTTGREVAESLAEHPTWQFGGMVKPKRLSTADSRDLPTVSHPAAFIFSLFV